MLIDHVHAKVRCSACMDKCFIPGKIYPIVDGTFSDESGTVYEDVRSLEDLARLLSPYAEFDLMVSKVKTY